MRGCGWRSKNCEQMNRRGEDGVSDHMIYFEMYPIFAEIKVRLRTFGPPYE
jgi:hypothetical protein